MTHEPDQPHWVVAFTKDWHDVPTCTTHLLREMGRTMPVLWIGSIGTRKPQGRSTKDWGRMARRLIQCVQPPEWKEHELYVLHPVLIPKATSRCARWLNRQLFRWYVHRARKRMGVSKAILTEYWCFVPNAVDLLPEAKTTSDLVVYYCADDWTAFHHLDGNWMAARERALVARADHVFATSPFLVEKLEALQSESASDHPSPIYMSHGVDYEAFRQALDREAPVPPELRDLPRPVVGFYGNLHPWMDFTLLSELAEALPDWSFVLIGENYAAPLALMDRPNVHLLGRREHADLPAYCRGFDVAIIPYDMSQSRMESVNPVKTKELLAAGLPVVASDVPVLRAYGDAIRICHTPEEWIAALRDQAQWSSAARQTLSASMQSESWQAKTRAVRACLSARQASVRLCPPTAGAR